MKTKRSEKGQALILIVFAILGLIGLTALAVDGGNAYSNRRRAQNTADASALAAAYAMVKDENLQTAGLARALSNGFDNDGTTNTVVISHPPISGPYTGNGEYIQVVITSHVDTYFGPVVGIETVTNEVEAVARVRPLIISPMAYGNAIVGLSPDDCQAVRYQGNAETLVTGGGLYVNSACEDSAFFNNAHAGSLTAPCLQAVGGITYEPGAINIPSDCILTGLAPIPEITYPDPECTDDAVWDTDTHIMSPGNYYDNKFPPAGVTNLQPGIYCVTDGDFDLNGSDILIGSDVLIVVQEGGVHWNGGATIQLEAPTTGYFEGLLLFLPESNDSAVILNGNSDSSFTGTFLAPSANITIDGTGGASGMNSQIIGYKVNISGASDMFIHYDAGSNWNAPIPASIELVQ